MVVQLSVQYIAPEILHTRAGASGYDRSVDMWSLGVILYVMLSVWCRGLRTFGNVR